MRYIVPAIIAVLTIAGCGKKAPPAGPMDPPAPEAPEPVPQPDPDPPNDPIPDAAPEPNADFEAALEFMDGRQATGRVVRVERGEDWYAEKGWTDMSLKLTVSLDEQGKGKDATWDEIGSVDWKYPGKGSVDCTFDSDFTPAMYMCVMMSTARVTTVDGSQWDGLDRYRWRFTFDDGTIEEFHVAKLPVREQTDKRLDDEDYELYAKLQEAVVDEAGKAIKKLTIAQ